MPQACLREARRTATMLSAPTGGAWIPGDAAEPGYFREEDAGRRAEQAAAGRLVEEAAAGRVVNGDRDGPAGRDLRQLEAEAWRQPLALADDERLALWSDDAPTRALAAQAGVRTFSTMALALALLLGRAAVGPDSVAELQRELVLLHVVDLPPDPDALLRIAAQNVGSSRASPSRWPGRRHGWTRHAPCGCGKSWPTRPPPQPPTRSRTGATPPPAASPAPRSRWARLSPPRCAPACSRSR